MTTEHQTMHDERQRRIAEDAAEILAEVGRYPQAWHEETADELRARFDRMRATRGGVRTRGETFALGR